MQSGPGQRRKYIAKPQLAKHLGGAGPSEMGARMHRRVLRQKPGANENEARPRRQMGITRSPFWHLLQAGNGPKQEMPLDGDMRTSGRFGQTFRTPHPTCRVFLV